MSVNDIKLDHVSFSSGQARILKDINETILQGELYCIIGTSGSGKSSLLKAINGLLIEIQGKVFVGEDDIYLYPPRKMLKYHSRCGFIFQNAALINNMSVFENLALPYQYHTRLSSAEIYENMEPHLTYFDIDPSLLELRPGFLSSGEKHIFGIIRALLRDPDFIFWDQPLSSLDHINQTKIKKLIQQAREKGKTNVLVTNDVKYALRNADRVGILHQGRLIAADSPEKLEKSENIIIKRLLEN